MSVIVNGELFDFDQPGMRHVKRPGGVAEFLMGEERVRSGTGYVLRLTDDQVAGVRRSLMGDQGKWTAWDNNCTMPIQRALESVGYGNLGMHTPTDVLFALWQRDMVAYTTSYPHL